MTHKSAFDVAKKDFKLFFEGYKAGTKPWISVEDDLPYKHTELLGEFETTVDVFCLSSKNIPYIDCMLQIEGKKWVWNKNYEFDCKYWMPIPKINQDENI